jgi:hypothetical protein
MATNPLSVTTLGTALIRRSWNRPVEPLVKKPSAKRPVASTRPGGQTFAKNVSGKIKYIFYRKQAFCLRRAITPKALREGGFWIHSYKPLGIGAYGRTRLESLLGFAMELSSAWHRIALEPDNRLTPDARELKRKLKKLIVSVRPMREVLSDLYSNP